MDKQGEPNINCLSEFLSSLVPIHLGVAFVISLVSLLFFAFLSKRNGAPCNSADYPDIVSFLAI